MEHILGRILEALPQVRYVAVYRAGDLRVRERSDIENASTSESDRYEELLVNPTMLKLLTQRGEIDCGGLEYVIVKYGNFYQFVQSVNGGHISVALESAGGLQAVEALRKIIHEASTG